MAKELKLANTAETVSLGFFWNSMLSDDIDNRIEAFVTALTSFEARSVVSKALANLGGQNGLKL